MLEIWKLTIVPRLATLDPADLTRARTTFPKLPSPISLITSKRPSRGAYAAERPIWPFSTATVILIVGAVDAKADCLDIYQRVDVLLPFQSASYGDNAMGFTRTDTFSWLR